MRGYFKVIKGGGGITYRAHWSLLFLILAIALPVGVALYVALILAHELGHAMMVRRYRGRVDFIDVHVFGGFCRYTGNMNQREKSMIAWGGILMQLLILSIALPFSIVLAPLDTALEQQVFGVLVGINLMMIATNAVPVAPLDGAEGWKLLGMELSRRKKRKSKEQRAKEIMDEIGSLRADKKKRDKFDIN